MSEANVSKLLDFASELANKDPKEATKLLLVAYCQMVESIGEETLGPKVLEEEDL